MGALQSQAAKLGHAAHSWALLLVGGDVVWGWVGMDTLEETPPNNPETRVPPNPPAPTCTVAFTPSAMSAARISRPAAASRPPCPAAAG